MSRIKYFFFSEVCYLIVALVLLPVEAQDAGSNAGQMWKEARSAFAIGDFSRAATILGDLIKSSQASTHWLDTSNLTPAPPKQQWLEPVFYLRGASYFNAKNWPDAIGTFTKYLQLFPKSSRVAAITFSLAQADLLEGNQTDAIKFFTDLLTNSNYHNEAFLLLVEADERAERVPDAISLLERERAISNLNPVYRGKLGMSLLALYIETKADEKGVALLKEMDGEIGNVQDIPAFNTLAIKLGDLFLSRNEVDNALVCYRRVRDNEQIVNLQTRQIEYLKEQREANLVRIQADPLNSDNLQLENKEIDTQVAKDQQILTQYLTQPPVIPPLYVRIGRAFILEQKQWEAAVVFREVLRRYPDCAEAETALYGVIVVFEKLKQVDRAQDLCQSYLTRYPQGKYAENVAYIRGALAYDAEDFSKALSYFGDALQKQSNGPRREQIELILGDLNLRQLKFDEAIKAYAKYQQDYPQGNYAESAQYRTGLALLFAGKPDDADRAIRAYLQKYPEGQYAADAEYRLAMVKFGAKQYDATLSDCADWQKKYGEAEPLAEVLSLEGDCYALQNKDDNAVKAYISSYQIAQTTEALNYSIFAAAKLLQKQAKWNDLITMFREFIKNKPDHPTVVSAIAWIGRAEIKLGKIDEAKEFLAATAKQYLDDPGREAVDEIISQLAQLYARRSPVFKADANSTQALSPAVPSPAKDLEDILTIPDMSSKATACARLLFAQAELARWQRHPDIEQQNLLKIAGGFKPGDLSPVILGQVGDSLMREGQTPQASLFYHELIDDYGDSAVVDYGYNGVGQIAFNSGDYATAETYFSKALTKGLAATKLKDITFGEAQALLALNRPQEAKPYFEQVASTRAWRGEATALSVYYLGEIQMKLGKPAEANAFYQRVYVAYQKYPDAQAKAYLGSGQAFEKMGRITEARNTYSEMLRNENLVSFPEASLAKQNLERLAQQ